MKHLKKPYILLLLLVTVIIASGIFAQDLISSSKGILRATKNVEPGATNLIFQSTDGGQTWQDISNSLPEIQMPDEFFAGESDIYLRVKSGMYSSKSNLETPVWQQETLNRSASISFTRSGDMAYNHKGPIFQKMLDRGTWLPIYKNSSRLWVQSIFETSDGTLFAGSVKGLYKSNDNGESWKQVNEVSLADLVESNGILIGTGQRGIARSTDKGEHWEWVISEGGVGIDVERIDGGFAAVSYSEKTKTRRIRISLNNGETWNAIDEGLPPSPSVSSIKQIGTYLICGHPDGIFRSSDMGKTWNNVHSDVDNTLYAGLNNTVKKSKKTVLKIYVSGNVLYAVARPFGC